MSETIEVKPNRLYVTEDGEGDYEIELRGHDYTFINREQANKLIVALGGTLPKPDYPGRGLCRDGYQHYCPNCDNTFRAES